MQIIIDRWDGKRSKFSNVEYFTVQKNDENIRLRIYRTKNICESYRYNSNDIIDIHTNIYD